MPRPRISVPQKRPGLYTRQRLIRLLDELVDQRLILVSAPAGYGKTSLLVDFAHRTELPVAWYSLDELDRDPRRFLFNYLASINHSFPDFGTQSRAYLESQGDAGFDIDLFCTQLVHEVDDSVGEHFILILDDVQFVEDVPEIVEFLNRFIQEVSEICHLVLSSRTLPALRDLPLLVARRQVGGIGFEELAFQASEIRDLIFQNTQELVSDKDAESLARESEGWITGLILSLWPQLQGGAERMRLARVSGLGLFDFLARQVLDAQSPELRSFLMKTALLGEFNAEICEAVFGPGPDWDALIRETARQNLFLNPVGEASATFRYHRLFEEFLRRAQEREDPQRTRASLESLAQYHARRLDWEKAREALIRTGDFVLLAGLIGEAGTQLARSGRIRLLSSWLEELPAEVRGSDAELLSLEGIVKVMLGQTLEGRALLDRAVRRLRDAGERRQLAQALVRRTFARRFQGELAAAVEDCEEAIRLTDGSTALEDVLLQAEACHALGSCRVFLGQYGQAIDELDRAAHLYSRLGIQLKIAMLQIDLGFAHHRAGDLRNALREYEKSLAFWESNQNMIHQATLRNNIAVIQHTQGDYAVALQSFEGAVSASQQSGYRRMEALSLAGIGDLYTELDVDDAALNAYHRSREIAQQIDFNFLVFYLDLAESVLAQRAGDSALAEELRGLAKRHVETSESRYEIGLYHLQVGRSYSHAGQNGAGVPEFQAAIRCFEPIQQNPELVLARLYLAASLHELGRADARDEEIRTLLASPEAPRHRRTLIVQGRRCSEALREAEMADPQLRPLLDELNAGIEAFGRALPEYHRTIRPMVVSVPIPPPLLKIRALGAIEVSTGGKPLQTADWGALSARDMLFCLLAHPDGLSKEALGAIFWPELAPEKVKTRFKNTIYRMRRAVGGPVCLLENDRYLFNQDLDFEFDVMVFEAALGEANKRYPPDTTIPYLEKALNSYRGEYLPGLGYEWVYAVRQRLQAACIGAALRLGDLYIEAGQAQQALDCALRVFELERTHEGACRLAMRAHAELGNRPAVARQFERCREQMLEDYQLDLSPQTIALFKRLTGSS